MDIVHALILGMVEGITEFLPVSSTAHLMLVSYFLKIPSGDYLKTFEIAIQLGAMLAVVVVFFKKIISDKNLIKHMAIGFVPTGIAGLIFYPFVKTMLGQPAVAMAMLFIGGAVIILFEKYFRPGDAPLDSRRAFLIGCFQIFAFVPGVSRALVTIAGGMMSGLSRRSAVEFSFLLATPTIAAATLFDVYKNLELFSSGNLMILAIGFITAFVSALVSIRIFMDWARSKPMTAFGWYRIILVIMIVAVNLFVSGGLRAAI